MFALLSLVVGFAGSFFPSLLKFFQQKQDNAHELEVLKLQLQGQAQGSTERIAEINVKGDIEESVALYKASELKASGIKWIDALLYFYNGTVRPNIAYIFVGLYSLHKIACIHVGLQSGTDKWLLLRDGFTEFDASALMLVLGYFFGQRMAAKVFKLNK